MVSKSLLQTSPGFFAKLGLKLFSVISISFFTVFMSLIIGACVSVISPTDQNYTLLSLPSDDLGDLEYFMVKENPISFGYAGNITRIFANPSNDMFVIFCSYDYYIFVSQDRGLNGKYIELPEPIEYVIFPSKMSAILISNTTSYITEDFGETFKNHSISFTSVNFTSYYYNASYNSQYIYYISDYNQICSLNVFSTSTPACSPSCDNISSLTHFSYSLYAINDSCICYPNGVTCYESFADSSGNSVSARLVSKLTNGYFAIVTQNPCGVYTTGSSFNILTSISVDDFECDSIEYIQGNSTSSFYVANQTHLGYFSGSQITYVYSDSIQNNLSVFYDFDLPIGSSFASNNGTAYIANGKGIYMALKTRIIALHNSNFFTPSLRKNYTSFYNTGYNLDYKVSGVNHVGTSYFFYYNPDNDHLRGIYSNMQWLNYDLISSTEYFEDDTLVYLYDTDRTYMYTKNDPSNQTYTENYTSFHSFNFIPTNESFTNTSSEYFTFPDNEMFTIVDGTVYAYFIHHVKATNPDDEYDTNYFQQNPRLYYFSSVNYSIKPVMILEKVSQFVRVNSTIYASTSDALIYKFDNGVGYMVANYSGQFEINNLYGGDHLMISTSTGNVIYYYDSDLVVGKKTSLTYKMLQEYTLIQSVNGSIFMCREGYSYQVNLYNIEFDKIFYFYDDYVVKQLFLTDNKMIIKSFSGNVTIYDYRFVPYGVAEKYLKLSSSSDTYFNNQTRIIEPSQV